MEERIYVSPRLLVQRAGNRETKISLGFFIVYPKTLNASTSERRVLFFIAGLFIFFGLCIRNRAMEAKGRVGGGEVRRLHIIYFLSRTGHIEQPHLIRITHLNKNGVYLRDVKRWLSDLRGKDMPDCFSWSYKRKYNKGYVWQDLVDDDLITPISDNEFVLKGSEIVPTCLEQNPKTETQSNLESALSGSESWSVSDDDGGEEKLSKQSDKSFDVSSSSSSLYSILLKKSNNNDEDGRVGTNMSTPSSPAVARSPYSSKSRSHGASLFRNLMTCGAADTKDSVLVMRNNKQSSNNNGDMCKDDKLGGSDRALGTCRNQRPHGHGHQQNPRRGHDGTQKQKQRQSHGNGQKKPYRPVRGPTCSQCGKSFKPEKLHQHMKSCRGFKAMAAHSQSQNKLPTTTNKSASNEPSYTYLLTN